MLRIALLAVMVLGVLSQYNINNQPLSSVNSITFYAPIITQGKNIMYQFNFKTYYSTDGYLY